MVYKYKHGILGGTFDRFHIGHERLLDSAFEQSEKVTVGITTSDMIKNKLLSNIIESFETRKNYVSEYLINKNYLQRAALIPIYSIYANSLEEKNIQALYATEATLKNAQLVNDKRKETGLDPLKIITVPLVKGEDGNIITSERIRYGEIDRNGHSYINMFQHKKKLILPDSLREEMRIPYGELMKNMKDIMKKVIVKMNNSSHPEERSDEGSLNLFQSSHSREILPPHSVRDQNDNNKINYRNNSVPLVITVGDIVSKTLAEEGYIPNISVIDFISRRQPVDKENILQLLSTDKFESSNEHGTISVQAVNTFIKTLKTYFDTQKKQSIHIDGEEDLLALPIILLAPLQSIVLYGLFDLGIVMVEVTEEKKREIEKLILNFKFLTKR